MLRKHATARANLLLFVCAPFSAAARDEDGRLDAAAVVGMLRDLVESTPHGGEVYVALDSTWVKREGRARVFAAAGWALTELLAAGAVPPELTGQAREAADALTEAAQPQPTECAPQPSLSHRSIAALARARFVQATAHQTGSRSGLWCVTPTASRPALEALARLQAAHLGQKDVVAASQREQLRYKSDMHEREARGEARPRRGPPPREGRWQLSALALGLVLHHAAGIPPPKAMRDALLFATEVCFLGGVKGAARHPLARVKELAGLDGVHSARAWELLQPTAAAAPMSAGNAAELARVLASVKQWREQWEGV
jgi:hypothetical protein